jgi:CHAT domain-containing protein/tetratricopeptide (TPR) repeat protein
VADALLNLGWFYDNMARYEQAQAMLDRCVEIRRRLLGPEAAPVAEALNALAVLEENRSNYTLAEAFYRQAIAIREKVLGPQNKDTATTLNNLATLYWITGDYAQAEKLFNQALGIREKTLGPKSLEVAGTLNALALLDSSLGDYDEAEGYFGRALQIRQARLGPDHPFAMTTMFQLGLLYAREGDDARAEPLLVHALEVRQKTYPGDHPDVARSLFQLGLLYDRRRLYKKAEPLLSQALEIRRKTLGTEHPEYAASLEALARHDHAQGRLAEALPLYEQAMKIDGQALGKNHPDTVQVAADLAYLKLELGKKEEAARLVHDVAEAQQNVLNGVFTFAPERQRMGFEKTIQSCDLPAALGDADLLAQMVLRTKGVVLDSLLEDEVVMRAARDPEVREWMEKERQLSAQLLQAQGGILGPDLAASPMAMADREKMEQQENRLEASLAAKGIGNGRMRRALATDVSEVREALPEDAALVEYVAYQRYAGRLEVEPAYGAVILTREGPARWIVLGSAAEIDGRVRVYQKYMRRRVRESALADLLHGLHKTLCQPVEAALPAGIHRLIISPDGALNFISFATLLDAKDHFFGEDFDLGYVSSGRDLLENARAGEKSSPDHKQVVIFADPDYSHLPEGAAAGTRARSGGDDLFPALPGTEREAAFLQQEAKSRGLEARVYRGAEASKANLSRQNSPYVLHLATHGLYLSPDEVPGLRGNSAASANLIAGQPMMRSLLALAGASVSLRDWQQGIFPPAENDGLLTAQEVAGLNLERTWLVVLSACDTGSGEARAGEGVLGLRRGFAEAGAQNLLMTLWTVDDAETADLMKSFYREALGSGDAPGALARAQRASLQEVRRKSGLSEAVRKAGPFILSY